MKNTNKITLCAISSALAVTLMLLSYFPYFTYAVPAVSGLVMMVPLIEAGKGYAFLSYIASSLIILFSAEPESKILFIALFGFYPILKAIIEKIKNPVMQWIIKMLVFNASVFVSYFVIKLLTDIDVDDFGPLGRYGALIFYILCNIAFVLYDIAIVRVCGLYLYRIHPKIKSIMKK